MPVSDPSSAAAGQGSPWWLEWSVAKRVATPAVRRVFRALATVVVCLCVGLAVLQGAGRIAMGLLDNFAGSANAWLAGRARVVGLDGGWDGLNPLAKARRVELPAGWLEDVTVELDVLESVRRGHPVLERLLVERAELAVERTAQGWRLVGMGGAASELDLIRLLGDVDEIRLIGRVAVAGVPHDGLRLALRGINRDGAHAYDLSVGNPQCTAPPCRFELHWRALDSARPSQASERYLALAGGVDLPRAFLAALGLESGLRLRADGRWLERGVAGGGGFNIQLDQVGLPGAVLGSLAVEFGGRWRDGHREGRMALDLGANQIRLRVEPVYLRTLADGVALWSAKLPLAAAADFLAEALGGVEAVHSWLGALKPEGDLVDVHAQIDARGVLYAATFDGLRLNPHRGVPWLREAAGEVIGSTDIARLTLSSETLRVGFADVFTDRWRWENVRGDLYAWLGEGYLGLRAPRVRFDAGGSRFAGSLSLARPEQRMGQRLAMLLDLNRLEVAQAQTYVPHTLSEGLRRWLREGPKAGQLAKPRVAYQGQVHTLPNDRSRRLEIQSLFSDAAVRYHPDWPPVTDADGFFELAGADAFATVHSARTQNAEMRDSRVRIGDNGAYAEVAMRAEVATGDGLDFIRGTPLVDWMAFVLPEWSGTGRLALAGDLYIPIAETNERPVDCRLDIGLADVGLDLPNYRMAVARLSGPVRYQCPHYLSAAPLAAVLFDAPAHIAAQADEQAIELLFEGSASAADLYRLIDVPDPGFAAGRLAFDATLRLAVDDSPSTMTAASNLLGLGIDLPGELAKPVHSARPAELELGFLEDYVAARFRYGILDGWLHVDEVPLRGAVGVRRAPPTVEPQSDEVVVSGRLGAADIEEWLAFTDGATHGVPWRLGELRLDRLTVDSLVFNDLLVAGNARDNTLLLEFASADLSGRLRGVGDAPLVFEFDAIRLPEPDGDGDPLDVAVIDKLPDADVSIASLALGGEDYGNWAFSLRQRPEGVLVDGLRAHLKGTHILATDGVFWHAASNRSTGAARLTMRDLGEVLPQWGYAPSLAAQIATLELNASWPGSPLNVEVNGLRGDVAFEAQNGRFVDVAGTGAQRILGLLNFNTILKRMRLNFSDVVAKGTSFDTITAKTHFHDGLLTFVEPAKVKGPGSDFKIGGSVNLVDGMMNANEMIVTLPVSDSLPWYAVYVSLANPVAGVAVLAGQQVLKKQIERFSSAKYLINGPWDEPEVKLVGIWNDDLQAFDVLTQAAGDTGGGPIEEGP